MYSLLKCLRCDWIDYLEDSPIRCPSCGSRTESAENLFAGETINCVIMSVTRKKTKVPVTFEDFTKRFNKLVTEKDMKEISDDEFERVRINLMMKYYIWTMLKRMPQLWLHIVLIVVGLKELMLLRMSTQLNQK